MQQLSLPEPLPNHKVLWQKAGGVAVLTLVNPPANGYSHEMMRDLDEAIVRARFDDDVHVIVLAGEGEKFFCAGADINMLKTVTPGFKYNFCLHANETLLRLEHTPKLTIAALNGHTVGGGLEVALACDLRLGRRGNGRLGLPEINLGVLPGTGGTQRLTRVLGKAKALQLMIEGTLVSQEQAFELGLVNKLIDAEDDADFLSHVLAYAHSFCPPERASAVVGHIKRAVQSGAEVPLEAGLVIERELQAKLFLGEDATEGIAAFLEKRTPTFKGR